MVLSSPELRCIGSHVGRDVRRLLMVLFGRDVRSFILYFSSTSSGVRFRVPAILDESREGRYARWSLVLLFRPGG